LTRDIPEPSREINYRSKPSTPEKIAAIQEREASFLTALNTVAELELVASKEVANLAGKILTMLGNLDEVKPRRVSQSTERIA
jgi:hypothetical protein